MTSLHVVVVFIQEFRLVIDHCLSAVVTETIDMTTADRSSCEDLQISPDPDFRLLNLLTPLEVGGASPDSVTSGLPNNNNFEGCLKNLRVNDMVRLTFHCFYDVITWLKMIVFIRFSALRYER